MNGWGQGRIRDAARTAAARVRADPGTVREPDLADLAASAIGLAVAQNPDLNWEEAVKAGAREIYDTASVSLRDRGRAKGMDMPRYWAYWATYLPFTHPHGVLSRQALSQVLDALSPRHYETLLIHAYTDSLEEGAEQAGVHLLAWRERVRTARRAALGLWFGHETPPALRRLPIYRRARDRTCKAGHLITGDNAETNFYGGRVVERCRACRNAQKRRYRQKETSQ